MSEPRALVEHFFRHEFGRLVAVLVRSLGVRRLDLVEDVVQAALVQALETWSRRGVPEDPAGWLYRTARNLAIDALRRERTHAQALPRLGPKTPSGNRRRPKRISPTRSATNRFACSSSAATKRCRPNPASPSRCGCYAGSAPRRSPARCSPPTPTSRSGSSGRGIGCASWRWILRLLAIVRVRCLFPKSLDPQPRRGRRQTSGSRPPGPVY